MRRAADSVSKTECRWDGYLESAMAALRVRKKAAREWMLEKQRAGPRADSRAGEKVVATVAQMAHESAGELGAKTAQWELKMAGPMVGEKAAAMESQSEYD